MTKAHRRIDERSGRRVLHITTWYPTRSDDPTGTFVREHVRAVGRFAPSSVLHIAWSVDSSMRRYTLSDLAPIDDVPVLRVTIGRAISWPAWLVIGVSHALIRELAARGRPVLLHTHTTPATALGALLALVLRRPLVATEHWTGLLPGGEGHRWHRSLVARSAFGRASVVMPVGPTLADGVRPLVGETPIEVVANVVDTSIFTPGEPDARPADRIVAIASLIPRKRVNLVISAVAMARRSRPGLSLVVLGDGPERRALENLAIELGIRHAVEFRGAVAKAEVAEELRCAELTVIASELETFSVVAAEAMCCGVPVVTTRCGGPEHLVDQQSGIVLDRTDVDALADALLSALSRTWDHTAISDAAHARFSPGAVARRIDEIYRRACPAAIAPS